MKPLIILTVVGCVIGLGPPAAYATTDASTWSGWGNWSSTGYQFNPNSGMQWETAWSAENNLISANKLTYDNRWSGGEMYDIEGLYMDLAPQSDGHTYLDWMLITSYAGLEPGENPGGGGSTTYTSIRDGANSENWAYRQSPVIAIDLLGLSTDPKNVHYPNAPTANYQWALVLDSNETCNNRTGYHGTDPMLNPFTNDIATTANLYSVTKDDAWVWVKSPTQEFPEAGPSDINTNNTDAAHFVTSGTSTRNLITDHLEYKAGTGGWDYTIPSTTWPMNYNWVWKGSIDITGTGFTAPGIGTTAVHYSMWCSNDYIYKPGGGFPVNPPPTPELSSASLLRLGMLPVGIGWLRRRKTA